MGILSGNNLKLVRRPGGLTAWMPDVPKMPDNSTLERNENGNEINTQDQWLNNGSEIALHLKRMNSLNLTGPRRTRHASLDMEETEIVLWNSNANLMRNESLKTDVVHQHHSSPILPNIHTRRQSLPSAPQPELMQGCHSVSMAPSNIMETQGGLDSPFLEQRSITPPMRESPSVNSTMPNLNNNNTHEDTLSGNISSESTNNILRTSGHSSAGSSTRNSPSQNVNLRKTKAKNIGKKRKKSAVKK